MIIQNSFIINLDCKYLFFEKFHHSDNSWKILKSESEKRKSI